MPSKPKATPPKPKPDQAQAESAPGVIAALDEFGVRKIVASEPASRLKKAGDKKTEGVEARSTAETKAFARAKARIAELCDSKSQKQEF